MQEQRLLMTWLLYFSPFKLLSPYDTVSSKAMTDRILGNRARPLVKIQQHTTNIPINPIRKVSKKKKSGKGFEHKTEVQQNTTPLISMCKKEGINNSLQNNYFPHWMDPLLTMSINKEQISARALFWSKSVCKSKKDTFI